MTSSLWNVVIATVIFGIDAQEHNIVIHWDVYIYSLIVGRTTLNFIS